jgi:DNA-binding NarL/FixJ family response regulator
VTTNAAGTVNALPPATDDVAHLVSVIGDEATFRLLDARAGTRVYVSEVDRPESLVAIIGLDAARKMRATYGATRVRLPVGRQWRVLCYKAMGLSRPKIARKLGCSETTVDDIIKRYGRPTAN